MLQKIFIIRLIAVGLFLVYGISFFIYLPAYLVSGDQVHFLILLATFSVLSIASLGFLFSHKWGQPILFGGNIFLAFYIICFYVVKFKFIDISYIFFSIVIVLYFLDNKNSPKVFSGKNWRSVLIIDDDEMFIKIIRPILMENGFSLIYSNRGDEGIEIAKSHKPDLILLDVILPGIKGREVCKILKQDPLTKDIPVIFTTAKDSLDDIQAEMAVGATAHLTKPINSQSLINTIRGVLK